VRVNTHGGHPRTAEIVRLVEIPEKGENETPESRIHVEGNGKIVRHGPHLHDGVHLTEFRGPCDTHDHSRIIGYHLTHDLEVHPVIIVQRYDPRSHVQEVRCLEQGEMAALRKDDLLLPGEVPGKPESSDVGLRPPTHHLSAGIGISRVVGIHVQKVQEHFHQVPLHFSGTGIESWISEIGLHELQVALPGDGIRIRAHGTHDPAVPEVGVPLEIAVELPHDLVPRGTEPFEPHHTLRHDGGIH